MRPLHAVALGLVVVAIFARSGDYDLLPDPVGWVLVLVGLKVLTSRVQLPLQGAAWVLGVLAVVASGALWVPSVLDWFEDADPALRWAMDVPALAFCAVLCHGLAGLARDAGATAATTWLQWTAIGFGLSVVAPVVVIGGGVEALRSTFEVVTGLAQLSLFVLCLAYAGREWAGAPAGEAVEPGT